MNDLEQLIGYYEEEIEVREERYNIEQDINYEKVLVELAFHESSHFVFNQLIMKMNLGFVTSTNLLVHCEKSTKTVEGRVTGLLPESAISDARGFYEENYKRLHVHNLTIIAGYASRLVFVDTDVFFIGKADLTDNYVYGKLFYYRLETASSNMQTGINDIAKICKNLRQLGVDSREQQNEKMKKILEDVVCLMKIPAMNLAIRYVKNILIKNNGRPINGKELDAIKWKVDILLGKVSLNILIDKML